MSAWRSGKSPLNLYRDDLRETLADGGRPTRRKSGTSTWRRVNNE